MLFFGVTSLAFSEVPANAADVSDAESALHQGAAAMEKNNYDKPILYCTEAIRLRPGYSDAYRTRGVAYDLPLTCCERPVLYRSI